MALTRKLLKEIGLSEGQVNSIIEAHADTVNGLKARIEALEKDAVEAGDWKGRYDQAKKDLDDFRAEAEERERTAKLKSAYRALLGEAGIDPRRYEAILRTTDLKALKLGEDGKLIDADGLRAGIAREWADFVQTEARRGSDVKTPPGKGRASMTREEIMAIRDVSARQRAIAENHGMFGF